MGRLILAACVVVLVLLIAAGAFMYPRIRGLIWPYLDRDIGAKVTIGSEWLEITPKGPLVADREIQEVVLWIGPPVKLSLNPLGCVLPDGSLVVPEVQLVGEDGKTYGLTDYGATVSPGIQDHFEGRLSNLKLPKGKRYRTARLRCEQPITVQKIMWRCYNPWDV